jgi:hypothetical protein
VVVVVLLLVLLVLALLALALCNELQGSALSSRTLDVLVCSLCVYVYV